MTPHALIFTLSAIGIAETVYLIRKRIASERPVCLLGEDCEIVLSSRYNKIFGVHNDILGFGFYLAVSLLTSFLVIGAGPLERLDLLMKIFIFSAAASSLFLIYLQWRVINAWCSWCLASSLTIFIMVVIILTNDLIIL